jgi:hypothetical protein
MGTTVMHGITGDHAFGFVEVVAAGVQIAVEAGEIAAGDFNPDAVA